MGTDMTVRNDQAGLLERVVVLGDLKEMTPLDRMAYYHKVCESLALNPLTRPFEYITLNGKLTLYARKDATEQLRKRDKVSVSIVGRELVEDVYVVTARATLPDGRTDESIGAVSVGGLKGENKANAMMKAETKSKRRVTLSICGLGMLDETEVETIPGAVRYVEGEEAPPPPQQSKPAAQLPAPANGKKPRDLQFHQEVDIIKVMMDVYGAPDEKTAWAWADSYFIEDYGRSITTATRDEAEAFLKSLMTADHQPEAPPPEAEAAA